MWVLEKVKLKIKNRRVSFERIANEWLAQKENEIKQSTYANYMYLINRYLMPELKELSIQDLEVYDFNKFIKRWLEILSSKTIRDIIAVLKSILRYAENTDMYDLYIGSKEGVKAPKSCYGMFTDMNNCKLIDLENLYTEDTTDFTFMFGNCKKLEEIKNIEYIDTSNATSIQGMFGYCYLLKNINLVNFDTKKVSNMIETFVHCTSLEELDLSTWNTENVTNTRAMFGGCSNLKTIYVSDKWNNDKVTISNNMFNKCNHLVGKISYDSTKVDITYANYDTGYFTYKTNE